MNSECVTAGNNLIPISIPLQCSCVGLYIFIHVYSDITCFGQPQFSCLLGCGDGEYTKTDIGIKLLLAVGVSLLIHCSSSTVMALLCIPSLLPVLFPKTFTSGLG